MERERIPGAAAHTAGFDELPGRRVRAAAELVPLGQFLKDRLVRVHPPGAMTAYSSYGMALAGLLVEDVSGEKLFAADSTGRIVALTGGSWRVVERVR